MKRFLILCAFLFPLTLTAQRMATVHSVVPITCTASPEIASAGTLVTLTITSGKLPATIPAGAIVHYEWFGRNIFFPNGNGAIAQVRTKGMPTGVYTAFGQAVVLKDNTQYAEARCTVKYQVRP